MVSIPMLASVPAFAGGAVLMAAAAETADPYVSLGVAGVLLAVIVVPTFRWLMARVDRQTEQQEKLIAALQQSVDQDREWQREARQVHAQVLTAINSTNELLRQMRGSAQA